MRRDRVMKKSIDSLRERRKYRRMKKAFGINIVSVGKRATLPKLDHEIGLNISLGGLLIMCEHFLKKNTAVGIILMLMKKGAYRTIKTRGRIIWCRMSFEPSAAYFMGIKFTKLSRRDKKVIAWFFR